MLGAGMAGLAAARELRRFGHDVKILEARNRIGGRIFTDRSLGIPVDFGAQWIEGTDGNPLTKIAESIGAQTYEPNEDRLVLHDPEGGEVPPRTVERIEQLDQQVESNLESRAASFPPSESVADVIRGAAGTDARAAAWIENAIALEASDDASRVSARFVGEGDEFGGSSVVLPGGYDQIAAAVGEGLDIRFGVNVRRIEWSETGVELVADSGRITADHVVITVPIGVLKARHIAFEPALPASKDEAIDAIGFGAITKVAAVFDRHYWPNEVDFVGVLLAADKPFAVSMNLSRFEPAPALLGYAAGSAARRLSSVGDADVAGLYARTLRGAYPRIEADPVRTAIWRWETDPFARGAYSFVATGSTATHREALAAPVGGRLFFAGEATNSDYPATVHGAYLSGIREARRVAGR